MNRKFARKLADTITNEQLLLMFVKAKTNITDWEKVSIVNKGLTKGVAWNVLAKDFDVNKKYHVLGKTNMIREFGEYLPEELKPPPKEKKRNFTVVHQNPDFNSYKTIEEVK